MTTMSEWEAKKDLLERVVVNDEEQYSLWPAHKDPPAGWRDAGMVGPRAECLQYIERVWTDMRPRSVRR
jgi:MbtH protein